MRCAQVGPLVERYVDGVLDAARVARIAAHTETCARCRARIEAARTLQGILDVGPALHAPRGFASAVMDAVYREALVGGGIRVEKAERGPTGRAPSPMYRRLGLSFLLTAAVLAASLLVPHGAYPSLVGREEAGLSRGSNAVVRSALDGAETAVRGILRAPGNGNGGDQR